MSDRKGKIVRSDSKNLSVSLSHSPDFTLAILLQHVGKLLGDRIRQGLGRIGLHPAQGQVLHVLAAMDGVSQRDLAHRMCIAAPTMSGVVRRMEAAKLLERRDDPGDERVIRLHLTDHGRMTGRKAEEVFAEVEAELIRGLPVDRLREVHLLLRELRGNIGGHPPWDEPPVESILPMKQEEEC